MKKIVVAAAALVKNDKLFIAQRPANKQPPLVWEFPGGKPENNETLPQALRRELQEELHVDTEIGDFIIHNKSFVKVIEKTERGSLICLDPLMGTEKTISPIKSPFGFDYFTKLVNLVGDMFNTEVNDENPFGNMLPWILMSGENNSNDILMMSMLMNKDFDKETLCGLNPMMFLLMQNGNGNNSNGEQ